MEGIHTAFPQAAFVTAYRIYAHPYLFDAMFAPSWPQWMGKGFVQVYEMRGAVNEVSALVTADDEGRLALERAGFRVEPVRSGMRLSAAAGGRAITQ